MWCRIWVSCIFFLQLWSCDFFFFSKIEDSLVRLSHLTWWRLVLASRNIVYLSLFHVVWSDFAVVLLTSILFLSFSTDHVLVWSNVELHWSFTVFAVVFQALVYIPFKPFISESYLKWPCRATITNHLGPSPPGGYSIYPWVGRCGAARHTLTLFEKNIADFPTLFKTEFRFLIPCLRHLSCLRQKLINRYPD